MTHIVKISLLTGLLLLAGCSLKEEPIDFMERGDFYRNDKEVLLGANGCYTALRDPNYYLTNYTNALFAASDMGMSTANMIEFVRGAGELTSQHTIMGNIWVSIYAAIGRTNLLINALETSDAELSGELKQRVIGEARFLRGLHYFNLVRSWGEVPLRRGVVTDFEHEVHLPLSSRQEVFDFVIADLRAAKELCWNRGEKRDKWVNEEGRATKLAATTLLAQVYLHIASSARVAATGQQDGGVSGVCDGYLPYADYYKHYYDSCRMECLRAIDEYGDDFTIENDWSAMWDVNTQNSREIIFAVRSSGDPGYGNNLPFLYLPRDCTLGGSTGASGGQCRIAIYFVQSRLTLPGGKTYFQIDNTDLRFDKGFLTSFRQRANTNELIWVGANYQYRYADAPTVGVQAAPFGGAGLFVRKWYDPATVDQSSSRTQLPVIRATEIYYMLGEALAELAENPSAGYAAISTVRTRCRPAADPPLSDIYINENYPGDTPMEQFREFILRERVMEYATENDRLFTLFRMGKVISMAQRLGTSGNISASERARKWNDYYWPIPQDEIDANKFITSNAPGY